MVKLMKGLILCLCVFTSYITSAQKSDIKEIKNVITSFSKAGDNSDHVELEKYLDDNYRIVMNRLFGSTEVSVMNKEIYLKKIASKEFGGDNRKVDIKKVLVNGTNATAKVILKGKKATFISIFGLIKTNNGEWKLISDTPIIE